MSPVRRARARRGQGELLRQEILQAAGKLLEETGDEAAVSIRAVADAVGVTPPSIYLHFADKNELIFAVCQQHFRSLDDHLAAAIDEADEPLDALRRLARAYVEFGLKNPEQYRILFMGRSDMAPDMFDDGSLASTAAFSRVVGVVQRCIDAGAVRNDDAHLLAVGLWVVVHGLTSLLLAKPGFPWPPFDALVDHVVDTQYVGLGGTLR